VPEKTDKVLQRGYIKSQADIG